MSSALEFISTVVSGNSTGWSHCAIFLKTHEDIYGDLKTSCCRVSSVLFRNSIHWGYKHIRHPCNPPSVKILATDLFIKTKFYSHLHTDTRENFLSKNMCAISLPKEFLTKRTEDQTCPARIAIMAMQAQAMWLLL